MKLNMKNPGAACSCRRGVQRDNCAACEGTGMVIDFNAIHDRRAFDCGVRECESDVTTHFGPNRIEAYDRGRAEGRKRLGLKD